MPIQLTSSAFDQGQRIPPKYTDDGDDISPPIDWSGIPESAEELALIVEDPDAPNGLWVHWVIYGIPASMDGLAEEVDADPAPSRPAGSRQGTNSWDRIGYGGPAPPQGHGEHRYLFKLYALDEPLGLDAGASRDELLQAMEGHIVSQGELMGTYER